MVGLRPPDATPLERHAGTLDLQPLDAAVRTGRVPPAAHARDTTETSAPTTMRTSARRSIKAAAALNVDTAPGIAD
jgi:hypothetical protein